MNKLKQLPLLSQLGLASVVGVALGVVTATLVRAMLEVVTTPTGSSPAKTSAAKSTNARIFAERCR